MATCQLLQVAPSILRLSPEQMQVARWCPVCQTPTAVIHQRRLRRIRDLTPVPLEQIRFRCKQCGITWTAQPEVIEAGQQRSQMLRALGVLLYLAGFSGAAAAFMLRNVGIRISAATIYRDVQSHRRRVGARNWERWRRAIQESWVEVRVAPFHPEKGNAAPGALSFPAGQLMLELAFACSPGLDSFLRMLLYELLGKFN
ncbi:hypothetical protein [Thermoflexus sp.]|uniref:hypothetical protein n=1 Tax=Thermoflexus sp. TaxID=1969742 RepID=UPI0029994FBE|nr:hypothetical protein [Thermoflexus sp.]MDW8065940.1 hypothetical protein [Anaerolineae bacterium]